MELRRGRRLGEARAKKEAAHLQIPWGEVDSRADEWVQVQEVRRMLAEERRKRRRC
jgi:hypothetical protein